MRRSRHSRRDKRRGILVASAAGNAGSNATLRSFKMTPTTAGQSKQIPREPAGNEKEGQLTPALLFLKLAWLNSF